MLNSRLIAVTKIWDTAPHNAFTGLTYFRDHWYCTFREAHTHMSSDGTIRIIRSRDGVTWESAALLIAHDLSRPDLRDPKIIVTSAGELALMAAGTNRGKDIPRCSYLWTSEDGSTWSAPRSAGKKDAWLWSLAREGDTLYSAAYSGVQPNGQSVVSLYRSCAGSFELLTELHSDAQFSNETALSMHNGTGLAIVRREFAPGQTSTPPYNNGTALLGVSKAPYTNWDLTDLGIYVGGPALLELPNELGGRIIVAGRKITNHHYTALWELNLETQTLEELLTLPSAGDCAYPGLHWHNDRLWVSYYSAHEGKCCIYFAEVELKE